MMWGREALTKLNAALIDQQGKAFADVGLVEAVLA